MDFKLKSEYQPMGDQPEAIEAIVEKLGGYFNYCTLMGVTGSGKTFTMANVVEQLNRPTLVLCHNKTLAAQLYSEFKNFFPENAVEYFVSYYDYYQPEAYLPASGTYIEKDLSINEEIEKMRLSATTTLLSGRRDVIVVSSVSCLYGIGNPTYFEESILRLRTGDGIFVKDFIYELVNAQYDRVTGELRAGSFRCNGDTIDVMPAFGGKCYRIEVFDDMVERITEIDPASGQLFDKVDLITIYPSNLFVTPKSHIHKALTGIKNDMNREVREFERNGQSVEAQRLSQRVGHDMEMIKEIGYCQGVENYSRYFDGREKGTRPFCLLDYFPLDYLMIVDESHVTIPQIRGMYGGDAARKENLVNHGFRLESAKDNRPLKFAEFESLVNDVLYVSATPSEYELMNSETAVVEQVIRPTGLVDPPMEVRITEEQIDDVVGEIHQMIATGGKVIITTITKRLAEEMSKYLEQIGVRNRYIHSDVETLDRVQILEDLRNDLFDVLIGVNLLREGLDLPEVGLVAILDADKEGFLRNIRSITQIAGRAARHAHGKVLLYGDKCTDSMHNAIMDSNLRRTKQITYNIDNHQMPRRAMKSGDGSNSLAKKETSQTKQNSDVVTYNLGGLNNSMAADVSATYTVHTKESLQALIEDANTKMLEAAKVTDYMTAMRHRDRKAELEKLLRTL